MQICWEMGFEMERLTNKREADAQRKEYERRLANGYPRNIPEERFLRLAAYEDTGLTPERCAEFARADAEGRYIVMRDAEQAGVARLRELAEADKDGRVVVLPCKGGDTVWRIVRDGEPHITRDEVRDMYFADDMTLCVELVGGRVTFTEKFGKTVFLSREEAENALQEMEDNKDG